MTARPAIDHRRDVNAKSALFRRRILGWFDRHKRDLPWRRTGDAFRIWVSEVMLQQTQVSTVIPYYRRFIKTFPTVRALAQAPKDRVMKLWEGLGYYARAQNLQAAAREVVSRHKGRIPADPHLFSSLPGVGTYTAAAVCSMAFGAPLAAVDGNVKRVLSRVRDVDRPIRAVDEEITRIAQGLIDSGRGRAGDINQAMMDLGAVVCTPRDPACVICPVRNFCLAFQNGTVDLRPVKKVRPKRPHYAVVAGIIQRNGKILIGRRPDRGLLGGLWEFPGRKVQPGETLTRAIRRELKEELGIGVEPGPAVSSVKHAYTHFTVSLTGFFCRIRRGTPRPLIHSALKWIQPTGIHRFAMPEANRKLLRSISSRFGRGRGCRAGAC